MPAPAAAVAGRWVAVAVDAPAEADAPPVGPAIVDARAGRGPPRATIAPGREFDLIVDP